MDDFSCCLSQIAHLCNEASIFLNQLHKFEAQFENYSRSSKRSLSIVSRFSLILDDLNLYYEKHFSKFYIHTFNYLTRKYFTIDYSNKKMTENSYEDIKRLNSFFNRNQIDCYEKIFYYLHKLTIICALCVQYRQTCTEIELADRFVYIRMDLLINLDRLYEQIRWKLMKINSHFRQLTYSLRKQQSKEKIHIGNMLRTLVLWLCLFVIGFLFFWIIDNENQVNNSWPI